MIPQIKNLKHTGSDNFFLMAGPCAIEGEEMALEIAGKIVEICERLKIPYIFKGSYRKANRSRLDSFTGIGDEKALKNSSESWKNVQYSNRYRYSFSGRSSHGSRIC